MAFNWNFKPKTLNGFNSQPVDTLNPQTQAQPIQMSPIGLRGNETWRNQYKVPERAAYMDEYEADEARKAQELQAQQAGQEKRKADLQNEIAMLERRIADNTAKLQKWTGNADQIAAIEARKINAQDPTSIWRWKEGVNQQRLQRQEDLARIEAEKKLNEAKNIELNRNKIDNILSSTMSNPSMTRDKLEMALKQLNDAEELAKQYKDTDSLKKINARKNELGIYVPVDDEANVIESEFVKNMEMVGKQGGMDKKQFAQYVQSVLDDPDNKHIWHYSPELQRKLYAAIGKNTSTQPANYEGY